MALFTETYTEILLGKADEGGYVTEDDIAEAIEEVFWEGSASLQVSGLAPGTELVWMTAVFKQVETDEGSQLVVASDIFEGEYAIGKEESATNVLPYSIGSDAAYKEFVPVGKSWEYKPYVPIANPVTKRIK